MNYCMWARDTDGFWYTSCGRSFYDGKNENTERECCNCERKVLRFDCVPKQMTDNILDAIEVALVKYAPMINEAANRYGVKDKTIRKAIASRIIGERSSLDLYELNRAIAEAEEYEEDS